MGPRSPAAMTFLVERYWPGASVDAVVAAALRGASVAASMSQQGDFVGLTSCTFVPSQETVFWIAEADDEGSVVELAERADLRVDRISSALRIEVDSPRDVIAGRRHRGLK